MGDKINSEKNEQVNYRGLFVIIGFHEPHSTHSSIIDVMKFACLVFRFVLFNFVMLFTCRLVGLGAHDDTLIEETTKEPNDLTLKCSLDCICYIKVQLQHILDRTPLVFKSFSTFFFLYHISWIFVINQVPCVSSCWGEKRHTRGLQRKLGSPYQPLYQ